MTTPVNEAPLRLLALDGGGVRGLSELLILKEIMHTLKFEENKQRERDGLESLKDLPKPCEYFDLIGGTSTGGIIALMLGRLRMNLDEAITQYDILVKNVFSQTKNSMSGDGVFKATSLESVIKTMVHAITGDPNTSLMETSESGICRTFVCARNAINMNIPVLFRSYESPHGTSVNCTIWESARATSATPTVFKRIEIVGQWKQAYVDGGMGHNNPCLLVFDEAKSLFPNRHFQCLVSIGTGLPDVISIEKPGFLGRMIPQNVIDMLKSMAMDCEHTHQELLRRFANMPETYFRFNVDQGLQSRQLSKWESLSTIDAHTTQYMKKQETQDKLLNLVSVLRSQRVQPTVEQLAAPRAAQFQVQNLRRKPCPSPVPSFTGRRDILDKMAKFFKNASVEQYIFVLEGLGGSGKSQIAFQFVKESNLFSEVFYVDGSNEFTLKADLESLAPEALELSAEQIPRWLARQTTNRWLLVIDNADDVTLNLESFLPTNGNTIITTRNHEVCTYATRDGNVAVGNLTEEEAIELLLNLAKRELNKENQIQAKQIVQELGYLALAISHAGAYILITKFSLNKYYIFHQQQRDHILRHKTIQRKDIAIYTTWKMSHDKLDDSAKCFLQICSLLHHEGISEEIFERAALAQRKLNNSTINSEVKHLLSHFGKAELSWSLEEFQNIISKLQAYSLIEGYYEQEQKIVYRMHPLVQQWGKAILGINEKFMQKCVLFILGLSIPEEYNEHIHKYQHNLWPHIQQLYLKVAEHLNELDVQILHKIGYLCKTQGYYKEAALFQETGLCKEKEMLGENHPDVLTSMANLGKTYDSQGLWQKAEDLQLIVIQQRTEILGENHPDTLTSMSNLANTYDSQGLWQKAEALQIVVLQKRKEILEEDHPDTLGSMSSLADTYDSQGLWQKAEALQFMVMQKRMKILGQNHPDTLGSMSSLANIYHSQGIWQKAEDLQIVVKEKRKEILGENHPDTLSSMLNLANTYHSQGLWQKAEDLQLIVMEKSKEILGEDHPHTLANMSNLANTYHSQGIWQKAEDLQIVVKEKRKEILGENHPDTLSSMLNLANTYHSQGLWQKAEDLQLIVMEKSKEILGEDHPHTLTSISNLARIYQNQGLWGKAEALQVIVMEQSQKSFGEDDSYTLASMSNLAYTYYSQGLFQQAEALQLKVIQKSKEIFGENHADTLGSMSNLALRYQRQGLWHKSQLLHIQVIEKCLQVLGESHPDTLRSMEALVFIYKQLDNISEAEAIEEKIQNIKHRLNIV